MNDELQTQVLKDIIVGKRPEDSAAYLRLQGLSEKQAKEIMKFALVKARTIRPKSSKP